MSHQDPSKEGLVRMSATGTTSAVPGRGDPSTLSDGADGADGEAAAASRPEMERALRRAVADDQLVLHYQPVVDLERGTVVGHEALLRWRHPTRGLLAPASFMPVAAKTGLIVDIGRWVLGEACRQAKRFQRLDPSLAGLAMSVNLSPRQCSRPDLAATVRSALDDAGLDPAHLWLEITESALVDRDRATEVLRGIDALGVRLSLDDFGTGYCSLTYLKRFPIKALKIDRYFVTDLPGGGPDSAIVAAVVGLADALELTVVAEGVETEGQRRHLLQLGCRLAQGFLFAAPAAPEAAEDALRRSLPTGGGRLEPGRARLPAARREDRERRQPARDPSSIVAILADSRRQLLWSNSSDQVEDVLTRFVRRLGGEVVAGDESRPTGALPANLAVGGGTPLLAVAPSGSEARKLLEVHLPSLLEDAEHAVTRLARLDQAEWESSRDPLTGVANRRTLSRALSGLRAGDALVIVDIDHFEQVNDRFGHVAGDEVLLDFIHVLRHVVSDRDLIGRYGDAEFLVLLRRPADPAATCAGIRAQWRWRHLSGPSAVTFSAGWARVEDHPSPRAALVAADAALYRAKARGRDLTLGGSRGLSAS